MNLMINISEDDYEVFKKQHIVINSSSNARDRLFNAVKNGTLLPKGHGRLIDADRLKTHFVGTEQGTDLEVYLESTIIDAPTVIEADAVGSKE